MLFAVMAPAENPETWMWSAFTPHFPSMQLRTASNISASALPSVRFIMSQSSPFGGRPNVKTSALATGTTRMKGISSLLTLFERTL